MSDNNINININSPTDIKINTLTIIVASIFIVLTVIFFFLLSFYTKYYWRSRSPRRHTNAVITTSAPPAQSRGLDPSILSSIPITMYKPSDLNDGFECAVCLSELAVGEEVRLLPKCSHVFHRECIDTWFRSHSTCPVCRCAVEDDGKQQLDEIVGLSANVNERRLMISIPVREDVLSTLACSRKSPVTPKLWPLRRILGKKTGGCSSSSSSSPRIGDIEDGLTISGAENGEGS